MDQLNREDISVPLTMLNKEEEKSDKSILYALMENNTTSQEDTFLETPKAHRQEEMLALDSTQGEDHPKEKPTDVAEGGEVLEEQSSLITMDQVEEEQQELSTPQGVDVQDNILDEDVDIINERFRIKNQIVLLQEKIRMEKEALSNGTFDESVDKKHMQEQIFDDERQLQTYLLEFDIIEVEYKKLFVTEIFTENMTQNSIFNNYHKQIKEIEEGDYKLIFKDDNGEVFIEHSFTLIYNDHITPQDIKDNLILENDNE